MSWLQKRGCVNTIDGYSIIDIVGKGTYGEVFKAVHIQSGDFVAIKKVCYTDIGIPKSSTREIRLFSALKHKNIVRLREIVVDNMKKGSTNIPNQFYLVFDYVDNDLAGIVRAITKGLLPPLSSHVIKYYIYQIVQVLDFLQSSSIIHRDIKLDNFLVTNSHEIKLCDFGLSRLILPSTNQLSVPVYALAYRPPEILLKMSEYDFAADIWALGILISTIILGHAPFVGNSDKELMYDILSKCGVIPVALRERLQVNNFIIPTPGLRCIKEELSKGSCITFASDRDKADLLDLCDRFLDMNPSMRPNTHVILLHPFFKTVLMSSDLTGIDQLKKCHEPLLNLVIRNYE